MKLPRCAHCDKPVRGHKQRSDCRNLYCGRRCFGLARRTGKSKRVRVAEKAAYDKRYRADNADRLKADKAAYFQRTYDPVKARKDRKKTMARHVAYCRRPEYKAKKKEYDRKLRAKQYGQFADAYSLFLELQREVRRQLPDKYERLKAKGYYTRSAQQRRRELWRAMTKTN